MNFIQLLDEAQITIPLISKEVVSDIVMRIVGPQNKTQQAFYMEKKGTSYSLLDQDPNGKTMLEGDPGLYYHEYCLCIARIGLEVTKDFEDKRKSEVADQLRFFISDLMGYELYKKAKMAQQKSDIKIDLTNNTKKIVQTLLKFEERMSELEHSTQEHIAELEDHLTKEIIATLSSEVDLPSVRSIIQTIDPLLAPLPPKPATEKTNPPPYVKTAVVVGEQIPVGKNQKPKPKPKPAKKNHKMEKIIESESIRKNTKDKPIKFEDMPGEEPEAGHQIMYR